MRKSPVASRYAHALLELGIEQGNFDRMREQLNTLAALFKESHDFQTVVLNPSISKDERKALLKTLGARLGLGPMVQNFTLLLLDSERFKFIEDIAEQFESLADEKAGRVRAQVTSAHALDAFQLARIKKELQKLTGATSVELDADVDASLIGGVVTRVGGMVLDGSIKHQLAAMRDAVLEET